MTIQVSTEDLAEIQEQAIRYGACVFKTKTTDGDDVWLAVQNNHQKQSRRRARGTNADAAVPAAEPATTQ